VPARLKSIITISIVLLAAVLVLASAVTKAQSGQNNTQVIMNLLNGQQYFSVPHIYLGDDGGVPSACPTASEELLVIYFCWPVYYGLNNASQYWSQGNITSDQPVLDLAPVYGAWRAGAMFWGEKYGGGPVTITIIGTYSNTSGYPGDGFIIYMFLEPGWRISPEYNYSIGFYNFSLNRVLINYTSASAWLGDYPSPVEGDVIFPQSFTPYIVVQWDPWWQYGHTQSGATGQWNVWIVNNTNGDNPSVTPSPSPNLGSDYDGWDGIGTGYFEPKPGDWIKITVTYDPSTNTLSGVAYDMNHAGWEASFTLNLDGYWTPPSSGTYVFGVGAASAGLLTNWALLYVAMTGNVTPMPASPPRTYYVNFTEVGLPPGTAWNVTLNGVTESSSNSSIIFTVPNGEYYYSVASPILINSVEYIVTEPSGTVTVNNANVTIIVHYMPVSTTEKLEVYSQFVKYFYSGLNLPNRFFVAAPSINGNQPSNVTGYIVGTDITLSFTYDSSSGYWVSNEVNMGELEPGSYELTVYAVYGNNYVVEGTYNITVLGPPSIVFIILSYIPIPNQVLKVKPSKLVESSIPLDIEYEWSLEKHITGLFNNTYEMETKVILKYTLERDIPVKLLSGNYSTLLEFPIFITLDSSGTVSIGGSIISKNLTLPLGPADVNFTAGGSAQGNFAISNYQLVLQSIDVSAFASAYGTYNIPTPWSYDFPIDDIGTVDIGFIVSISFNAGIHVNAVLVPVNNPSGPIPLAPKDVTGNVFVPFGVEGTVGASVHVDVGGKDFGNGLGAAGGLQGVAGVGFLLQRGGSSLLESPGGAMVGEVNVFVVVSLTTKYLIIKYRGSWTILGPGVIYEWGSVTQSDIALFENELQQAAQQFQWQAIGSDWVNGSTFGIITNNTSFGYGYSITNYNGLVYIYYTELTPSGVAVIRGSVFNGTTAMSAPLPAFNDLGEASPLLVRLDNGSLMMLWAGTPMGNYNLNNLTILLQASVLHNNTWGPVVDLTKSGDAMSYASDGEYIYLVYEPKLSLTYNNTVLEELTPTGVVVRALSIPGIVGITGAWNGLVVVQFINGTYALINMNTGAVEPLNASIAGFSDSLLYYFYNGTLTIINGTQRLVISLPTYANAFPMAWSHGLVIIAWRPGLLSVFNWNGTTLQPIRNYTTVFTIVPGATIMHDTLYLAWFSLENETSGRGVIYLAIQSLPHPVVMVTTNTTMTTTVTNTTRTTTTNTTAITTTTTSTTKKPTLGVVPTWVIAAAVVAAVVLIIAILMIKRGSRSP